MVCRGVVLSVGCGMPVTGDHRRAEPASRIIRCRTGRAATEERGAVLIQPADLVELRCRRYCCTSTRAMEDSFCGGLGKHSRFGEKPLCDPCASCSIVLKPWYCAGEPRAEQARTRSHTLWRLRAQGVAPGQLPRHSRILQMRIDAAMVASIASVRVPAPWERAQGTCGKLHGWWKPLIQRRLPALRPSVPAVLKLALRRTPAGA